MTRRDQAEWIEYIRSRCTRDQGGCLIWTGAMANDTPVASYGGKLTSIHRRLFEAEKRAGIPLVRFQNLARCPLNPRCVEPSHHQPRRYDRRETCVRGHPLDARNVYVSKKTGSRVCRRCQNHRTRAFYARMRTTYLKDQVKRGEITEEQASARIARLGKRARREDEQ